MSDIARPKRSIAVSVAVVLATLVGGVALTGSATAASNLHDGSVTDPSTGETIYAANSTEKKSMTYGYVVENVTNTGESVELYLTFDDKFNNTKGDNRLSSFSGNVTCVCGGSYESVSISSSPSIVDGPDGDGNRETIKIGVQPSKRDQPIDLIVNFTGDVTWSNETTNVKYPVSGAVIEPNKNVSTTQFEDVIVAGGLYTETAGASSVTDGGATLNAHVWDLNGTSSADLQFTYWEEGKKSTTKRTTSAMSVSNAPDTYSQSVAGLNASTTYVFKSTIDNGKTTDDGPTMTFTTGSGSDGSTTDDGSNDPTISNYQITADGSDITVTFDTDETLADIEVDVRGAESATLHTEDFDGNEVEGYTATYEAGTDGDYTLELVVAEDSGGNDGADDGDYTGTVTVSGTSDGTSSDATTTPTDSSTSDDTSGDATPTDAGTSDDSTSDGSSDDSTTDDGTSSDDSTTDDGTSSDDGTSGDDTTGDETPTDAGAGDDGSDDGTGDDASGDDASGDDASGEQTATEKQPGFGSVLALVALLASAVLFYRRH